jgi:hypothetical protein
MLNLAFSQNHLFLISPFHEVTYLRNSKASLKVATATIFNFEERAVGLDSPVPIKSFSGERFADAISI